MEAAFQNGHSDTGIDVFQEDKGHKRSLLIPPEHTFVNPFQLKDLLVFDVENLRRVLKGSVDKLEPEHLALSLYGAPPQLLQRFLTCLPDAEHPRFLQELARAGGDQRTEQARQFLLDSLFWELTYWQTPEMYEELTAGEQLHPGIFQHLEPLLDGKVVLDAGAGSGRASFEMLRYGAKRVYAIEPSPGLLRLLRQKIARHTLSNRIISNSGDFAHLPLANCGVDLALACSAFTAETEQGGEAGLAELKRVTRPGGYIVVVWPRTADYLWLKERGFHYVTLPHAQKMSVHFSSLQSALRCAHRFYGSNPNVLDYFFRTRQPDIPFSVLGFNPPSDYCWLQVN